MQEKSSVMQSCCASIVVAGVLASSASEKLHVYTAQSHGMTVSAIWASSKSSAPPN